MRFEIAYHPEIRGTLRSKVYSLEIERERRQISLVGHLKRMDGLSEANLIMGGKGLAICVNFTLDTFLKETTRSAK